MKKKLNYIIFLSLLFFIHIFVVNAVTIEIKDGSSYADLSNYSKCEKQSLDDTDTARDNLKLDEDSDGNSIVFVTKVPSNTRTLNLYCGNKTTNKQESVTIKVEPTASVYDGYSENEDKSTYELTTRRVLSAYATCETKNNRTGNDFDYISVENTSDGPVISVKKVPDSGTSSEFVKCTTSDGRTKEITFKVTAGKSYVPPYKYGSSDEEKDKDNVSNDCESIFGNIKDDGKTYDPNNNGLPSVAYVLQKIFDFMKVLGPLLVLVLSIMDLVKVVASSDKDSLNKFLKTTSKRLIYAVLLFVVPTILNLVLSWVTTSNGTCGIH